MWYLIVAATSALITAVGIHVCKDPEVQDAYHVWRSEVKESNTVLRKVKELIKKEGIKYSLKFKIPACEKADDPVGMFILNHDRGCENYEIQVQCLRETSFLVGHEFAHFLAICKFDDCTKWLSDEDAANIINYFLHCILLESNDISIPNRYASLLGDLENKALIEEARAAALRQDSTLKLLYHKTRQYLEV